MYFSTTRWTTAVAAAALIALPVAASAQSSGTTPPQQPPTQAQPQTQPPPMQPAPQQPATAQPGGQVDPAAAKQHLTQARDTLSQITSMPEAAKLQGDARNQVSQLIANFNELITTQANWRASYEKVDANLTSLLGPDAADPNAATGTAGAVGTSGTAGTAGTAGTSGTTPATPAAAIDPAIKAKLAEFRTHVKAFEQAAGGASASGNEPTGMTPPASANATNPANPPASATGATGSNPPAMTSTQPPTTAGATGTSGATADQAKATEAAGHAEADKHLDAIDAILAKSKTGTLTKVQTVELKKHVEELRKLLQQQR